MKEFIKCRDVIVNKRNIQCVSIECLISGERNIIIKFNNDIKNPIYIMCNNEAEARKEFDNICKQLQEEDTEESQPQKYKITLKEFWESGKKLTIHCNTEEEAKKLLMAFDKLGKEWTSGKSYAEESYYDDLFCSSTCYSNDHRYGDYEDCKKENYEIYEFEDVDLEN